MADRMASSDVAKRRRLNDLETSLTTPMRGRLHENIDYIVENLTERPVGDKGNDVVTYRIRMLRDRSLDPRETVIVKACPRDDSKRRREGRPEVGFSTVSCEAIPVSQTVVDEKAYTLVRDPHTGRVQDIYFSIEVVLVTRGKNSFPSTHQRRIFPVLGLQLGMERETALVALPICRPVAGRSPSSGKICAAQVVPSRPRYARWRAASSTTAARSSVALVSSRKRDQNGGHFQWPAERHQIVETLWRKGDRRESFQKGRLCLSRRRLHAIWAHQRTPNRLCVRPPLGRFSDVLRVRELRALNDQRIFICS